MIVRKLLDYQYQNIYSLKEFINFVSVNQKKHASGDTKTVSQRINLRPRIEEKLQLGISSSWRLRESLLYSSDTNPIDQKSR